MATRVADPYVLFLDTDGDQLDAGSVYIGTAGLDAETNQIQAYSDQALTVPVAQPVATTNGRPSLNGTPINIYVNPEDYSIKVKNRNDTVVVETLNNTSDIQVLLDDYISKVETAEQPISSNLAFAADKLLKLLASASSRTELLRMTNSIGQILGVNTNGNNLELSLKQTGAFLDIINAANQTALKIRADGVRTGPSSIPTDILNGTSPGKVLSSSGQEYSSQTSTSAANHYRLYTPNGRIVDLQTIGNDFQQTLGNASGSYLWRNSSASLLMSMDNAGSLQLAQYGAGTLQTDSSGNVTAVASAKAVSAISTRSTTGTWTLSGLTADEPIHISADSTAISQYCYIRVISGSLDNDAASVLYAFGRASTSSDADFTSTKSMTIIPSGTTVEIEATFTGGSISLRAYQ